MGRSARQQLGTLRKRIRRLQAIEEMYERDHAPGGPRRLSGSWVARSIKLGRPAPLPGEEYPYPTRHDVIEHAGVKISVARNRDAPPLTHEERQAFRVLADAALRHLEGVREIRA